MPPVASRRLARIWLNLPLQAKGATIVAIPSVFIVCMLVILFGLQRNFETANQWVLHTEQVLAHSEEAMAASLRTEASAREYLISRDPSFLARHRAARERALGTFNSLIELVNDNPPQQEKVRQALRLVQDEIAALDTDLARSEERRVGKECK